MDEKIVFTDEDGNGYTQRQLDEAEAKAELAEDLRKEDEQ